jgi:hypothetical protein
MILTAFLHVCAACAATPVDIRCPDSTKACHLIVDLAEDGRVWPQAFPLGAVRIAGDLVWWLDGISFATASVAPRSDLRQVRNFPLDMTVGDIRTASVAGNNLLVLSKNGIHVIEPESTLRRNLPVPSAWALAADNTHIAWTVLTTGTDFGSVMDMEHGVLAEKEYRPGALAVDGDDVYWVSFAAEGAIRALRRGETAPVTLAERQPAARAIAVDKERIYWLCDTKNGRMVRSAPKRGGKVTEMAHWPARQGTTGEERLIVQGGAVYWIAGRQLVRARGNEVVELTQGPGRVVSFDVDDRGVILTVEIPAAP